MKNEKNIPNIQFDIITLFPQIFDSVFSQSIILKAQEKGLVKINIVNLRDFGEGRHKTVDAKPYGGGSGMVLRADILLKALRSVKKKAKHSKVILLSPQGKTFNQKKAKNLKNLNQLILICGHYEGVDERIKNFIDEEISIGDYILTGGEIPAMVIIDTVSRLVGGVVGKKNSIKEETFEKNLLKYPQYTKPLEFEGLIVPKILLSGNHQEIEKWRDAQSLKKTKILRPDLLKA
jgi:tRNA (guanine37-N1)-methyltransferase